MTTITLTDRPQRELAHRRTDDLDVTLYWCPPEDRLCVEVLDRTTGAVILLEPEGRDALDAFRHPFLYGRPHECG